ncbi:MAG: branched-chain amino acid ABC transporter permease [Candidatus Kariarchaeaceae archaeon]|jgi:branched-subunit amino acid ABC-type transport system permease component
MSEAKNNILEKNLSIIFALSSVIMFILEQLLDIINNAMSTDFTRLSFYLFLIPVYLYLYGKFISKRGVDSSKFKLEQEKFKLFVSGGVLISFVTASMLYTKKFVILRYTSGNASPLGSFFPIEIISFQQYFFFYLALSAIIIRVFGTDEEFHVKYSSKSVKYIMGVNFALLFLMPAFLVKWTIDKSIAIAIFRGEDMLILGKLFGLAGFDYRLSLQFQSEINFIEHQTLIFIAIITFGIATKAELSKSLKKNNKNKIGFFTLVLVYMLYDFVALSLGENSPSNMLKQTEIIMFQASTLIMISAGLTLTTRVRKFGNFAHAEFVVVGLYAVVFIKPKTWLDWTIGEYSFGPGNNIFGWMLFAFLITGIVGMLGELLVFAPLDRRKAVPLTLMVGSIGLGLIIRQSTQEAFTGANQSPIGPTYPKWFADFEEFLEKEFLSFNITEIFTIISLILGILIAYYYFHTPKERTASIVFSTIGGSIIGGLFPILFTTEQYREMTFGTVKLFGYEYHLFDEIDVIVPMNHLWSFLIMVLIVLVLRYIFVFTTLGISMRATADDDELAQITGINTRRVIYWTWFIAAGVTGIGALWRFEAANIVPASGFLSLLIIFAVVILGGFDSFEGTLISAFIIAISQNISSVMNSQLGAWEKENDEIDTLVFWNPNGDWTQVIPFMIIIIVLLIRPRGIFGVVDPRSKL